MSWLTRQSFNLLATALVALSLAACGGGSSDNNPSPGGGSGGGGNTGDMTVDVSPSGELRAKEDIVVSFNESMDPDSIALGGTLGETAQAEWSSTDNDSDTLTLVPSGYWAFGEQSLVIDGSNASGNAIETVEATFNVQSVFSNFPSASVVIGQTDFDAGEVRQGSPGADANTLDTPIGPVAYAEEQDILFIPDDGSSRLLGYRGIPDVNNANADFALGQPDLTSSRGDTDAGTYRNPQRATTDHGQLLVTDSESRRVLVYDGIPESGPVDADVVIGQADMTARELTCDASTAHTVHSHFVTPQGRLFMADSDHHRVLMWNEVPTENGAPADLVLGQPDFTSCNAWDEPGGSTDMRTFKHPTSIWSDDERLVIVDNENNRIFLWNEFPEENFAEPDVILGQADFENVMPNDDDQDGATDNATARTLNEPWDVVFHNGQLFVADQNNNRILVWNGFPQESFQPADIVIGQEDFESAEPNHGNATPTASGFNRPRGVAIIGDQMFITDMDNSRVLVFNTED